MSKDLQAFIEDLKRQASNAHEELRKSKPYQLIRTYGEGMGPKDLETSLKQDTAQAYAFYTRDQEKPPEKPLPRKDQAERTFILARDLFLSFLMKLNPVRRLLYVISAVTFVWALVNSSWWLGGGAFVILNFLLALELADKLVTKDELDIARSIQLSLQPEEKPEVERLRLSCHYQPAKEVGGDYYDFASLGDERFTLILGDVSGKGMPAALYAMKLQGLFELLGKTSMGPREMLVEMNEVICEKIRRNYFITAVVGMVDFEENKLTLARAGHNLPLHFCSVKGTTNWLNPPGLGIGMKKNPGFGDILEQTTVSLRDDDLLLFYTDGITEAMNRQDQEFGTERMERVLVENAHRDVNEIKERLLWHVAKFTAGAPVADDATMVIARILGDSRKNQ